MTARGSSSAWSRRLVAVAAAALASIGLSAVSPTAAATVPAAPTGAAVAPGAPAAAPTCSVQAPTTITGQVSLTATLGSAGAGAVFLLDGVPIGRGFATSTPSTTFSYAAYGTKSAGWPSAGTANGTHALSCYGFGSGGRGSAGPATTVNVSNPGRATITAPADRATVAGVVAVTATFTSSTDGLPTSAAVTLDGAPLGTAACTTSGTTATCRYSWDTPATTMTNSWDMAMGLRVIGMSATVAGSTVTAPPIRTFVNNRPEATLLLSAYEQEGLGRVGRDGGWSTALPGDPNTAMYTFGDGLYTPLTGPAKPGPVSAWGNTYALTTIQQNTVGPLNERPNPNNDPANSPSPSGIVTSPSVRQPDGSACKATTTWSTGIIARPSSNRILVSYWSLCQYTDGSLHNQIFGIADLDPGSGNVVQYPVFTALGGDLPEQQQLMSPTQDGSYLYWWRSAGTASYLARVPLTGSTTTPWTDRSQYRWYTAAGGWSADPSAAADQTPTGAQSTLSSVARVPQLSGNPWLMITDSGGAAGQGDRQTILTAPAPTGPWTVVPEWNNIAVCGSCTEQGIYSVYAHPESSSASRLVLTFSDGQTHRPFQRSLAWPASLQPAPAG